MFNCMFYFDEKQKSFFNFYYLLHKCRNKEQIIYLCYFFSASYNWSNLWDFIAFLPKALHSLFMKKKIVSKETCNSTFISIHFHSTVLMPQGFFSAFFIRSFCTCLTKQKRSLLQPYRRAHELDNTNGKNATKKIRALFLLLLLFESNILNGFMVVCLLLSILKVFNKCFLLFLDCVFLWTWMKTKSFCGQLFFVYWWKDFKCTHENETFAPFLNGKSTCKQQKGKKVS